MNKSNLITATLVLVSAALAGCTVSRFTPTGPAALTARRAPVDVHVFAADEAFGSYREVGVLEVGADSFPEAQVRMQELGGEYGCHAVRFVSTATNVFAVGSSWASQTTYLGSCMVPATL